MDKHHTKYADIRLLKVEQVVYLDDGFTCRDVGPVTLFADEGGQLCFVCKKGKHNLYFQCDDGVHCVGVYTEPQS